MKPSNTHPLAVTWFAVWLSPFNRIRYSYIKFYQSHGIQDDGHILVEIVDEIDRQYFISMTDRQLRRLERWCDA